MARILVVGDVILDEYITGTAERLSPEAPIPIVKYEKSEYRLGGAGNVAANVKALGAEPLLLCTRGNDEPGQQLGTLLQHIHRVDFRSLFTSKRTTHKVRLIANNQQIARLDGEDASKITDDDVDLLMCYAAPFTPDAVIVSDYAKGLITEKVLWHIANLGVPAFLDPKLQHADLYRKMNWGGFVMTPNVHEAEGLSGVRIVDDVTLEQAGRYIRSRFGCKYVLITRGEHGMTLFNGHNALTLPTVAQSVFDVSGAGDTVIAALAVHYTQHGDMAKAAEFANKAAGIVVGKRGTAVVSKSELE